MPPNMQKRILNEIADVNDDETAPLHVYVPDDANICKNNPTVSFFKKNNNYMCLDNLLGSIVGPRDTPYQGKIYRRMMRELY